MNILVVCYIENMANNIMEVIKKKHVDANIDVVYGTDLAMSMMMVKSYDIVVIDMMVQEEAFVFDKPILEPAIEFLHSLKNDFSQKRVFALFDEDETGKKGQDEIAALGYELADYDSSSIEWERKLLNYI